MNPSFLTSPPRHLFFTGKGGVGKTSIACASAVTLAERGRRVLLVSTDPASNVGQVFCLEIGSRIRPILAVPGLVALEIDPQAAAARYRSKIVDPVRGVLPDSVVKGIEEQLSGACTTEIAAFDEFTSLLVDADLTADFDHIVFDTAPTGHTIRLLSLPGAWSGFLEKGEGDASCLGPLAGLEKHRKIYQGAVAVLSDPIRTLVVLVARPQRAALKEAARTSRELRELGISSQALVVNAKISEELVGDDPLGQAIVRRENCALSEIPPELENLSRDVIPLHHFNLMGVERLRQLFANSPSGCALASHEPVQHAPFPGVGRLIDELAAAGHGLILVMGKGGVGKTTVASAIGVALADRGLSVHLSTSDPAAHLAETLVGTHPLLQVSRIDPLAETERYRQEILLKQGAKLEAEARALLEEDLRSPCTEEVAVFRAFSRIIEEADEKFVVLDTAPTGHTMLLLDATGAYHRELARKGGQGTTLQHLQDPVATKVVIVTLAEPTPILEARHLSADLARAGIHPWAWIVNASLAAAHPTAPLLCTRAAAEYEQIVAVQREIARWAVIPFAGEEPIGIARLRKLLG